MRFLKFDTLDRDGGGMIVVEFGQIDGDRIDLQATRVQDDTVRVFDAFNLYTKR